MMLTRDTLKIKGCKNAECKKIEKINHINSNQEKVGVKNYYTKYYY